MDPCVRCLTNNPRVVASASRCEAVPGGGMQVLLVARDRVHSGTRLLSHPLSGNFRPHQQPYRTVVLQDPSSEERGILDLPSLHLLEEALEVYRSCASRIEDPRDCPCAEDYSLLDFELIRETLSRYGLLGR